MRSRDDPVDFDGAILIKLAAFLPFRRFRIIVDILNARLHGGSAPYG